jgi:hypothetical protein
VGPAANARAWILRWTGHGEEADEHNQRAVEAMYGGAPMQEAQLAGWLDLADGRVLAGDLDAAAEIAARLASLDTSMVTMAWYQAHRLDLLRARLFLADGDRDLAAALALDVEADANARGARRHALVAASVAGLAGGRMVAQLDEVVAGLASCAGLDGWRLVGELATRLGVDQWRAEAQRRAAALVAAAGDLGDSAKPFVDRVLG